MKNVVFLIFFILGISLSSSGQEVSNKNWTLIHERTADWCPYCGTWGWDMKTQIFDRFADDNVIFMAVHHSGGLNNIAATEFGNNYSGVGQPIFYVDGFDINASSNNISQKLAETQLELDFKASVPAIAGVGINASLSHTDNTLKVDAKVEFLGDVEGGNYYFGLYLLEDVTHSQASRNGPQLHKQVLRKSLLSSTYGNALQEGAIAKGTTFTISANVPGITEDRENYKVAGIIWNKVNNKYLFFNANMVNVGIPASSLEIEDSSIHVFQSESSSIIIDIKGNDQFDGGLITVTDVSGKTIAVKQINNGQPDKRYSIDGSFSPGIHIVTLTNEKNRMSKKVLIQ